MKTMIPQTNLTYPLKDLDEGEVFAFPESPAELHLKTVQYSEERKKFGRYTVSAVNLNTGDYICDYDGGCEVIWYPNAMLNPGHASRCAPLKMSSVIKAALGGGEPA